MPAPTTQGARRHRPKKWEVEDLNRLLAAARTMPGKVLDSIPAKHWWPALVLTFLDTQTNTRDVMSAPRSAYDHQAGTLTLGMLIFELHPLTIEALDAIRRHDEERLFPWPLDTPAGPHNMLYRRFKEVLYRANLPHTRHNLFSRLRVTAFRVPNILDVIDPKAEFPLRDGKPRFPRALEKRRWAETVPSDPKRPPRKGHNLAHKGGPELYRLQPLDPKRSLAKFLREYYVPLRLADCSEVTRAEYAVAINKFAWFLACEPTFDHLTDDHLERYVVWLKASGSRKNITCNNHITRLLALWRFAWRKRKTDEQPRDVTRLKQPKHVPRAWTIEEFERILRAADQSEGTVNGVPAGTFWLALLLTLYYTGFRIGATLTLRGQDFDPESGTLDIPAAHQKHRAEQVLRLPSDAADAIRAMGDASARDLLFPFPYGVNVLRDQYKLIVARAGLPVISGEGFHKLRRTSASYLARETDDRTAQQHLGHSSLAVTTRYLDPRITNRRHTSELMQRPQWRVVSDEGEGAA